MPAFAALLSSSLTVSSLGLPVSAIAETLDDTEAQAVSIQEFDEEGNPIVVAPEDVPNAVNPEDVPEGQDAENNEGAENNGSSPTQPVVDGDKDDEAKPGDAADEGSKDETNKPDEQKPDGENKDKEKEEGKDKDADPDQQVKPAEEVQPANPEENVPPEAVQPEAAQPEVVQPEASEPAAAPGGSSSYTSVADDGSTLGATLTELKVASRLLDAGWTPEMIAAAIGNMYAESGSNAASLDDMSGMFNYAYEVAGGLFQWTDCGSSSGALSSAGFTALTNYAEMCGKDWRDPTLQTEYFLKTWREDWMERQTYYDATSPEFAHVDVSVAAFDECDTGDFDSDGIVDSRDDDIDGDGIKNDMDQLNEREINGQTVRYAGDSVLNQAMKKTPKQYTEDEARQHVAELTFAFMAGYEGPSARVSHLDRRIAHALRMYPAILALKDAHDLDLSENAALVVASAATMLGGKYTWGAESPAEKIFDCSGLTRWCYSLVGVDVDHYSETQRAQADATYQVAQAVPGDILWKPGHVGIYIGNGTTVEAKGSNYGIVYGDAKSFDEALHFDVLDERAGEGNSWTQTQDMLKQQAQDLPGAIQDAANHLLK